MRKVYVFPGLYPQLYPRFALDAGALWRTSTDSKSLIYQRKRAFAGCWRTSLDVNLAGDIESPYVKSQKFRKVPTKIPTKRKVSPPTSANCGQFNAANTSASAGAGLSLARRCPSLGATPQPHQWMQNPPWAGLRGVALHQSGSSSAVREVLPSPHSRACMAGSVHRRASGGTSLARAYCSINAW